jgi:hypothetical protein
MQEMGLPKSEKEQDQSKDPSISDAYDFPPRTITMELMFFDLLIPDS